MPSSEDDLLKNYIRQVFELKQTQRLEIDAKLTPEDLQSIALEMGMSPADLELAQQQAQQHLTRGQSYLQCRRWSDAIHELEQARSLNPFALSPLHELARGYQGRYLEQNQERDRQSATTLAKQCLELQPDYAPALALLSELDRPLPARSRGLWDWASSNAVAIVGLVLLGCLGFSLLSKTGALSQNAAIQSEPTQPRSSIWSALAAALPFPGLQARAIQLPIALEPTTEVTELVLEPRQSRLSRTSGQTLYQFQGLLVNQSDRELQRLTLKAEFLDASGRVMMTHAVEVIGIQHVPLEPGDRQPFSIHQPANADLKQVRLTVQAVDHQSAIVQESLPTPVKVEWPFPQPARLQFRLAERQAQLKQDATGRAYHDVIFEITNTGNEPIQTLAVQLDLYNALGERLDRQDLPMVYGDDPPLLPGETRVKRSLTEITPSYARYAVKVLEID